MTPVSPATRQLSIWHATGGLSLAACEDSGFCVILARKYGRLRQGTPHSSRLRRRDGHPHVRLRRRIQYDRDAFPSQQGRRQCRSDRGCQRGPPTSIRRGCLAVAYSSARSDFNDIDQLESPPTGAHRQPNERRSAETLRVHNESGTRESRVWARGSDVAMDERNRFPAKWPISVP
jgi:hypothetical protein